MRRLRAYSILAIAVLTLTLVSLPFFSRPARAQGNVTLALDPDFGGQGIAEQPAVVETRAMVRLPNGALLIVGESDDFSSTTIHIAKFTPQGTPDATFGAEGVITATDFYTGAIAAGIALDSNARMVVLVQEPIGDNSGGSHITLLRYLPTGQPDTTFDGDGRLEFDDGTNLGEVQDLALLSDNRIVALVDVAEGQNRFYRFTATGALDTEFGTGGFVGAAEDESWRSILADSDNQLLVTGGVEPDLESVDMGVWRFTLEGDPDSTFGTNGRVIIPVSNNSYGYDLVQTATNTYVVSGSMQGQPGQFGTQYMVAARLTPDGDPDTTFDGDGVWMHEFDRLLDTDGVGLRLVVDDAGIITIATTLQARLRLVQLLANGAWNTDFGTAGISEPLLSGVRFSDYSLYRNQGFSNDAEGNLYIGGVLEYAAIQKFTAQGAPDRTFGAQGGVLFGTVRDINKGASARQPDGKIVLAVVGQNYGGVYATRLLPDGTPDLAFGADGITQLPDSNFGSEHIVQVALDSQGRILVLVDAMVVRLLSDGTVDTTFGNEGVWYAPTPAQLVIQSDDRLVLSFKKDFISDPDIKMIRLLEDGTPDTTFGTDGAVYFTGCGNTGEVVTDTLRRQPDDKILYLGGACAEPYTTQPLYRLTADGQPDTTFGIGGVAEVPAWQIAKLWNDQHLLITGRKFENGQYLPVVMRLTPNGLPDSTFGDGGIQVVELPTGVESGVVDRLVVEPQGSFFLFTANHYYNAPLALAIRLLENGDPDTSFGTAGVQSLSLPYGVLHFDGAEHADDHMVLSYVIARDPDNYPYENGRLFVAGVRLVGGDPTPTPTVSPSATPSVTLTPTEVPPSATATPSITPTPGDPTFALFLPLTQR